MKDILKLFIAGFVLIFAAWAIRGCNRVMEKDFTTAQIAERENRWKEPERKITVTITVNKYSSQECKEAGGTFVVGNTKELLNALVGCIEREK